MLRTKTRDLNLKDFFLLNIILSKISGFFFRLTILLTKSSFDPDTLCPSLSKALLKAFYAPLRWILGNNLRFNFSKGNFGPAFLFRGLFT